MSYVNEEERKEMAPYPRLTELNKLILSRINKQENTTVLGFLNVTDDENDEIFISLLDYVQSSICRNKEDLLNQQPVVTAYAMAVVLSDSDCGMSHWKAINGKLGLGSTTKWNASYERCLEKINEKSSNKLIINELGKQASYVNFQAGIRKSWTESLRRRLNKLQDIDLPDVGNEEQIRVFADNLASQGEEQKNLIEALKSPLGLYIVEMLCRYKEGDENNVAPHLREVFQEVNAARKKRARAGRNPYLCFNRFTGDVEIVLPKLKSELTNENTLYRIGEHKFKPNREHKILVSEFDSSSLEIGLVNIEGRSDRLMVLGITPNTNEPFFIFDAKTGSKKQRSLDKEQIELSTGEYYLAVSSEVVILNGFEECFMESTGDSSCLIWNVGEYDPLVIEEGEEVLGLEFGGNHYQLVPTIIDKFSFELCPLNSLNIEGDVPLLFGDKCSISIVTTSEINNVEVKLLSDPSVESRVYDLSSNQVAKIFSNMVANLPQGISLIEWRSNTGIQTKFYFWNGLKSYNDGIFEIEDISTIKDCKFEGFEFFGKTLKEKTDWSKLHRQIRLPSGMKLTFPKPGLACFIYENEEDEGCLLEIEEILTLKDHDQRLIEFRCGGFDHWEIVDNKGKILDLSPKRKSKKRSLSWLYNRNDGMTELDYRSSNDTILRPLLKIQKAFKGRIDKIPHRPNDVMISILKDESFKGVGVLMSNDPKELLGDPTLLISEQNNWGKVQNFNLEGVFDIDVVWVRRTNNIELKIAYDCQQEEYGAHLLSIYILDENDSWKIVKQGGHETQDDLILTHWCGNLSNINAYELAHKSFTMYSWLICKSATDSLKVKTRPFYNSLSDPRFLMRTYPKFKDAWWETIVLEIDDRCKNRNSKQNRLSPYFLIGEFPEFLAHSKGIIMDDVGDNGACLNMGVTPSGNCEITSLESFSKEGQFSLKGLLVSLNEARVELLSQERNFTSISQFLTGEHFHYALSRLEERSARHREVTYTGEGDGRREEIAYRAYDRIWSDDQTLRNKERKRFNEMLEEVGLSNFNSIRGKMWFARIDDKKDKFSEQISYIFFRVALAGRLLAHRRITHHEFKDEFNKIFESKRHFSDLIAFGPELLCFYMRMFDEALKNSRKSHEK